MEILTKEEIKQFEGRTLELILKDEQLLRTEDCAFYAALNDEEAAAFCDRHKLEHPDEDGTYTVVDYDMPDIRVLNSLFDKNYKGFELVNMGLFVPAEYLYEKRAEVISRISNIYDSDGGLYVPLDEYGTGMSFPVGEIQVTTSFFTDEEEAKKVAEGGVGMHTIERWISNPPKDMSIYSIDGQLVYGWEIVEATNRSWGNFIVTKDRLSELISGKELMVLAPEDDISEAMRCDGMPIVFLEEKYLQDFADLNSNDMDEEYTKMLIKDSEDAQKVVEDCDYTFLDAEEGRFVCRSEDLICAKK